MIPPAGLLRLAVLLALLPAARATCLLPVPAGKGAGLDEAFQHVTPSADGFFHLHWNSSGDSALAAERVPDILAGLQAARARYQSLPGSWEIPLGPRPAYPVLVVRQDTPGATTLPYSEGGVEGLTWIQLDHDFARWGGDPGLLLEATCAHELFHALQFALGADLRDLSFYEASAVWAEDLVFPAHDDWASRYLPALLADLREPLDTVGGLREYGAGAVVKFLLEGAGDWSPCRTALARVAGDPERRCWTELLAALPGDPEAELAACLGELLGAGAAADGRRVPELAGAPPVDPADLPALTRAGLPGEATQVEGPGWCPLAVRSGGSLRLAGEGLYLRTGIAPPAALADSAAVVAAGDWLLAVNPTAAARPGVAWLAWDPPWEASFRLWPNPGGCWRSVEFAGPAAPLEFVNLRGQRVGLWVPPGPGRRFDLALPPAASGTLLVRIVGQGRGVGITLAR